MAQTNGKGDKVLNIRLSGDTGAHIPVKINNAPCLALIDTGASRSCMSTKQHEDIGAPLIRTLAARCPVEVGHGNINGGP